MMLPSSHPQIPDLCLGLKQMLATGIARLEAKRDAICSSARFSKSCCSCSSWRLNKLYCLEKNIEKPLMSMQSIV